jgi:hypothetical protein
MHYYTNEGYLLIASKFESLAVTPEEVEILDREHHEPEYFQESQMLNIFPEATKYVRARLKELGEQFRMLDDLESKTYENLQVSVPNAVEREKVFNFLDATFISPKFKKLEREQHKLKQMLGWKNKKHTFSLRIAKSKLITELLKFDSGGYARCIWHHESTPSLKYYKEDNHVFCFGCGKGGDVIDVYSQINNCSLAEAIKALS